MIARYVKLSRITQCVLANRYLAGSGYCIDACTDPVNCNSPCPQGDISVEYAKAGISSSPVAGAIDSHALWDEITSRRPVLAMLQYDSGASHVVLLTGSSQTGSVYVIDTRPGYGEGWVDYTVFKQAHGHGAWTASWTGIS